MSFFGIGDQDWVEMDLDAIERSESETLASYLLEHQERIESEIGPFEVQVEPDGTVTVVGDRSYRVEIDRRGRLMFTGVLDPDGPL